MGYRLSRFPTFQGRTPVGVSSSIVWGQIAGEESHTLISSEVPVHTHQLQAAGGANQARFSSTSLVAGQGASIFAPASSLTPMNAATLTAVGGSQAHENRQPFLVMNWCIALSGIFPSRN